MATKGMSTHTIIEGMGMGMGITIMRQVLWGIKTNALALLADACHNFSDILALAAAWLGHALSKRKPTERFSYGMKRATILASVTNAGLLLLVTGGIIWESIICLFHPVAVQGLSASAAAAGGIFVNGIAALLLMKGSKDDLNMRGAFLHMASDAVLAVGVVVSGLLVAWTGMFFLDPLTSLILSIVIVLASWRMLSESINLALDAAPTSINPSEIPQTLKNLSGIIDIHHLHIWPISTTETALTVHLVIEDLSKKQEAQSKQAIKFAIICLPVSLLVLSVKASAWFFTGSTALFSDALETLANVAAAVGAIWAVKLAALPPDKNHPYGHAKAEAIFAIIESSLVFVTGIVIGVLAVFEWFHPVKLETPFLGAALNGSAGIINLIWGIILVRWGRENHSPALLSTGNHMISDIWASIGLVIGVILIPLTGWDRLDAVLSLFIGINVVVMGAKMFWHAAHPLMDQALPEEEQEKIDKIIWKNACGQAKAHDLRMRRAGKDLFTEFHLAVPDETPVWQAYDICSRIENALKAEMGNISVHIYLEPDSQALLEKGAEATSDQAICQKSKNCCCYQKNT
ncbi:cation efflux system protein [Lasius niger]|uniref:Cation efflux system protein n=1 Tax=Lasius niger TaxID=67767 RepID=A0A0J7KWY9_LASNI|nr:cation efflux system protein [Lasius niger]